MAELTVPSEVGPTRELVVYGSVFYENGERIPLPELHLRSPASAGASPPG